MVKSSEPGHQPAGYVVIDAAAFDPTKHELFEPSGSAGSAGRAEPEAKKQPRAAKSADKE